MQNQEEGFEEAEGEEEEEHLRWKLANIIIRVAKEKRYAIVLEGLGKNPARGMINP